MAKAYFTDDKPKIQVTTALMPAKTKEPISVFAGLTVIVTSLVQLLFGG